MRNGLIEIRITKGVLFLTERELLSSLPGDILREGLRRGKAIKRWRELEKRLNRERGN